MTDRSSTRRPRAQLSARIRLALTALLVGVSAVAQAARDDLALVSRQSDAAGAAGNGDSLAGSISADGRFVAFRTRARSGEGRVRLR